MIICVSQGNPASHIENPVSRVDDGHVSIHQHRLQFNDFQIMSFLNVVTYTWTDQRQVAH